MSDKPAAEAERRVYMLPSELVERIRAYQAAFGLPSEVEAVRRLLDGALQHRETLLDVLAKLKLRWTDEKDLRVLAREVLVGHALVKSVAFADGSVDFTFADGERGRLDTKGRIYRGGNSYDDWDEIKQKDSWGTPV